MDGFTTARSVAGLVAAWIARAGAAAAAVLLLAGPPDPISDAPLGAEFYIVGATIAGGLLATFRATRKVGTGVLLTGLWAMSTYYGVIAFADPRAVISDSQLSARPSRRLSSNPGAYALGAFFLLVANVPAVAWLWSQTPIAQAQRTRRYESRAAHGAPPPSTAPAAQSERIVDRRQASRRRRKRKLERR